MKEESLYQIFAFTIREKTHKNVYNNNRFKISASTWNNTFEISDGSYSVSDIQYYFDYIFKKHRKDTDNPSITIYSNKKENRITFKLKVDLELLTLETMRLLESTEDKITTPETMRMLGSAEDKTTKDKMIKMYLI